LWGSKTLPLGRGSDELRHRNKANFPGNGRGTGTTLRRGLESTIELGYADVLLGGGMRNRKGAFNCIW